MAKKKSHKTAHHSLSTADALLREEQAAARRKLDEKLPSWAAVEGLQCPPRLSLEQCSSEATAQYKFDVVSRLVPEGGAMADLTGGYGVDFAFLAPHFRRALYVEQQEVLCGVARHNFPLLGLNHAEVRCSNGVDVLEALPPLDFLYLDPARRPAQAAQRRLNADELKSRDGDNSKEGHRANKPSPSRAVLIEDCEPNVAELLPTLLAKSRIVMVKLAPMLDISRAVTTLQNHVAEVHIVATRGECKELLLVLTADETAVPELHVVECGLRESKELRESKDSNDLNDPNLPKLPKLPTPLSTEFIVPADAERTAIAPLAERVETYLYEPSAAVLKAGLFKWTAAHYGLRKLHANTHLYTADHLVTDFPGRTFRVVSVSTFSKQSLRTLCASVASANLAVRNFPDTVASLRRRLKLPDGGPAYWFATTLADNSHVIIDTRKVEEAGEALRVNDLATKE